MLREMQRLIQQAAKLTTTDLKELWMQRDSEQMKLVRQLQALMAARRLQ